MKENKTMMNLAESSFRKLVVPFIKHADDLEVNVFEQQGTIIVEPRAHYADTGKVIGKGKANFAAVQTILALVGHRHGFKIRLNNLLPSKVGDSEFLTPFDPIEDWPAQETFNDLKELLGIFLAEPFSVKVSEDDDWTTYTLTISQKEKLPISSAQIARELSKLMHATGRARGRLIKVEAENKNQKCAVV